MSTLLKVFTWFPSWRALKLLECIVSIWKPVTRSSIFVELLELSISIALREAVTAVLFDFDWVQSDVLHLDMPSDKLKACFNMTKLAVLPALRLFQICPR
jgi:hypothetical protein